MNRMIGQRTVPVLKLRANIRQHFLRCSAGFGSIGYHFRGADGNALKTQEGDSVLSAA